jgi:hypothetical protein
MRITIIGAEDVGKQELAKALSSTFDLKTIFQTAELESIPFEYSLGSLIDYRVELALGINRAFSMLTNPDAIFVGTLFDSLAHQYANYSRVVSSEATGEPENVRGYLTSALLYAILIDSYKADVTVFIPMKYGQSTSPHEAEVDKFYPEAFDFFGLTPYEYDGDLDTLIEFIKEANGSEPDNQQSSQEESPR